MTTTAVRPLPWQALEHDFATPVTDVKTLRQAAGLDWEPATEPQYRKRGDVFETVDDLKYVTRGEGGPVLASAHARYYMFGHERMLAVADDLLGLAPKGISMQYVAGGPLYGGKRVWLCAQLGKELYLPGDDSPYVKHLVLSNSHDGHGALKILPVEHRITCANSIHRAEMEAGGRMAAFTFSHTSKMDKRVDDAKTAMAASMAQLSKVEDTGTKMLDVKLSRTARADILGEHALRVVLRRDLKGIKNAKDLANSQVGMSAVNATVAELDMLLGSSTCAGIQDTAWGVYQAMVEHADHIRATSSADRYVVRAVMDRNPDKAEGFKVLQAMHRR